MPLFLFLSSRNKSSNNSVYINSLSDTQHCVLLYLCIYFVILIIRVGSACSHVAAVLFKLQACVQLGMNEKACTSKLCQWNVSRRKANPVPLQQMSFNAQEKEIYRRF